jgi:hypothetical protein
MYRSFGEIYCPHIHAIHATDQSTNHPTNQPNKQTNKQTDKKKKANELQRQSAIAITAYLIQHSGIHMTKVFFSKDFLPEWSLLLPVVTTKLAEHIRINTFPSYFEHYSFYILAMCFIVFLISNLCLVLNVVCFLLGKFHGI